MGRNASYRSGSPVGGGGEGEAGGGVLTIGEPGVADVDDFEDSHRQPENTSTVVIKKMMMNDEHRIAGNRPDMTRGGDREHNPASNYTRQSKNLYTDAQKKLFFSFLLL